MSVIRVNKTKDYTVMSNHHLRDMSMSYSAKGLLSLMLSLPDDWDYSVEGLVSISKEGEKAVRSTLRELEQCGYLIRTRSNSDGGRFQYIYDVYESPQPHSPCALEGHAVEGHAVGGHALMEGQLNTNTLNTEELITEEQNRGKPRFVPPTVDEVRAYCRERGNKVDAESFVDFYESKGWMVGKNRMKDWKACIRTWERNNKEWGGKGKAPANYDDYSGGYI